MQFKLILEIVCKDLLFCAIIQKLLYLLIGAILVKSDFRTFKLFEIGVNMIYEFLRNVRILILIIIT